MFLIRHAESEANAGTCDHCDCGLTETGRRHAEQVGWLLGSHFDLTDVMAITSPYRRTRETADVIGRGSGLMFDVNEGCREWGKTCIVDGKTYPEEKLEMAARRLERFLRTLAGKQRYVIVSHATPIFLMMNMLVLGSVDAALEKCVGEFWLPIKNCGVTHVCDGKIVCVSKLVG